MRNNEKFIKRWEKNRQKGKVKYIVSCMLIYAATYCGLTIIINVIRGKEVSSLLYPSDMFIAGLIGSLIGLYFGWNINEERYAKTMRNKKFNEYSKKRNNFE